MTRDIFVRSPTHPIPDQGEENTVQVMTLLQKKGRFVATVAQEIRIRQAIIELARYDIGALVVTDWTAR